MLDDHAAGDPARTEPPRAAAPIDLPWWTFPLFGLVVVLSVTTFFLWTTRCPCATDDADGTVDGTVDGASHFVVEWTGDAAPPDTTKLHFLLATEPYTTFSCDLRTLLGVHDRVRLSLPSGAYYCRAVFLDGMQSVCGGSPIPPGSHRVVRVSEAAVRCAHEPRDRARGVPAAAGGCVKDHAA